MADLILDTDVCIDYLRNHSQAAAYLYSLPKSPVLSVVTVTELYTGVKDGQERADLLFFLGSLLLLPVNTIVAERAGEIRRQYSRSHGVGFADTLMAATALESGLPLVTLNAKHFPMLTDLQIPYTKP